jgi:hypothetical protein
MWRISKQETRWFVAAGLLALVVVLPARAQTPLVEQALSKLRESPPVAAESFDFVVLGDSNTLEPLVQSDIFRQFLREFNILRPNLVIEVGDLVVGGAAEGVPAQWDLFDEVIKTCNIPYVAAPGNHDISDAATERIWIQRMGPTRYSFHYGNSFFVFLDSEEVGALERISDEQVAWLKGQLDLAQAKNIFVFLHQPYFEHEGDPDRAAEDWEEHWANVAAVFRGHPVRVVFAGHKHVYRDCGVREGVRYVISGGSASYGMNGREEEGSFHHYLLVRVRGEDVSWSVIKPGAILPENVVTSDRIGELERIRGKWLVCEELPAPYGEGFDRDVTISIDNPFDRAFDSTITWEVPAGWNIVPMRKSTAHRRTARPASRFGSRPTVPRPSGFPRRSSERAT